MKKLIVIGLVLMELGIITYIETRPLLENKEVHNQNNSEKADLPKTMYALMVEQTPGGQDYIEQSSKEFPKDGYKFNASRSGCVDKNGNTIPGIIDYDESSQKVIVTTNMTAYCYVYFDIDNSPIISDNRTAIENNWS